MVRGRFGFLMGLEGTHLHVLSLTKIKYASLKTFLYPQTFSVIVLWSVCKLCVLMLYVLSLRE